MTKNSFLAPMLTAFALSAAAVPAAAADPEIRSQTVFYGDLDLASDAGVAELDRRIDRAARNVCGFDNQRTGTRIRSAEMRNCHAQALRGLEVNLAALVRQARQRARA